MYWKSSCRDHPYSSILWKKTENNYDPKIERFKYLELIDLNIIWLIFNTESKGCKFTRHASSHSIF